MARNQALTENEQQLDQHTQENSSFSVKYGVRNYYYDAGTLWPSGLRRWLKAPVRKAVGSNPTGVISKGISLAVLLRYAATCVQ